MVGTVADCGFARLPCAVSLIIETFAARRKQCRVLMIRCRSWGTGNCEKIGLMITRAHIAQLAQQHRFFRRGGCSRVGGWLWVLSLPLLLSITFRIQQ